MENILSKPKKDIVKYYEDLLEKLSKKVAELEEQVSNLKEKINLNSNNSSIPSSVKKGKNPNKPKEAPKKRGALKGHKGHSKKIRSSEEADKIIELYPDNKCSCGGDIGEIKLRTRKQIIEIPSPRYELIEYQVYEGKCVDCKTKAKCSVPSEIGQSNFGVRLHSFMSLMRTKYRLSKRQVKELLSDIYGVSISLGSVSNAEGRTSMALELPYNNIIAEMEKSKANIHIDETGYRQLSRNGWAWVIANNSNTYFHLSPSRGKKIALSLLGRFINKSNIFISDRYPAYNFIAENRHQLCWAHLKRDFTRISEREGKAGKIGRKLLFIFSQIFKLWKKYGSNYLLKVHLKKRRLLINKLKKTLLLATTCGHKPTERTCDNILSLGKSIYNFLYIPDLDATNNLAERQIRPLVISKKLSFGANSDRGCRFIERAFSIIMTCAQQQKNPLDFFQQALKDYFNPQLHTFLPENKFISY